MTDNLPEKRGEWDTQGDVGGPTFTHELGAKSIDCLLAIAYDKEPWPLWEANVARWTEKAIARKYAELRRRGYLSIVIDEAGGQFSINEVGARFVLTEKALAAVADYEQRYTT